MGGSTAIPYGSTAIPYGSTAAPARPVGLQRLPERSHQRSVRPSASVMDPARARELLSRERARIEQALARFEEDGPLESSERVQPGDRDSENLYEDEFDTGRREDLRAELAAVERAEARLAAGTYGISVDSGKPIPDARLEARPTAERTAEEDERFRHLPG